MATDDVTYITLPLGQGGLNGSRALTDDLFPLTDLAEAEGITFEEGTCKKEGGATPYNTTALSGTPTVQGVHDFILNNGTQILIAATGDGKIVSVIPGGIDDTLQTGLGTDKLTVFVEGGGSTTKKLFRFNGYDPVGVTSDGVTMATISDPAADWTGTNQPIAGTVHNSYLWAWGNNADFLYRSKIDDHEDFATVDETAVHNVYPGDGGKLYAAVSYHGRLFLFKQRGIYWLDDTTELIIIRKLTGAYGIVGPRAWCYVPDDILFFGSDGLFHLLSATTSLGDVLTTSVLPQKLGSWLRQEVNLLSAYATTGLYYGAKSKALFVLPQKNSSINNRRIDFDLSRPDPKATWSARDTVLSLTLRKDTIGVDRPIMGDDDGVIWTMDETARSKDGDPYPMRLTTRDMDLFENGTQLANLHSLSLIHRLEIGSVTVPVTVISDGRLSQTVTFTETNDAVPIPEFIVGTDSIAEPYLVTSTQPLTGDAGRIRIQVRHTADVEVPNLMAFVLGVTEGARTRGGP